MDLIPGLLAIANANEIDFEAAAEPGWFSFNFGDIVV